MDKLLSLLLCIAAIFSLGCSRNLPAESEKPAAVPRSTVEASKPAEPSSAGSEPQPEPKLREETPNSEAPTASSAAEPVERDWRLMLVNPDHLLPDDWTVELAMTKYGYEVDARIVDDVTALVEAAAADNVSLLICYGYRTLEQSQQLFDKQLRKQLSYGLSEEAALAEAKRWVAPPGTSDHHTGLALDIVTPEHQVLNHAFYDTPAGRWMAEHSWEYGFVIRFPKDKQEITGITYEPWHLRFVGKEHAAEMQKNNECLEEYATRLYGE